MKSQRLISSITTLLLIFFALQGCGPEKQDEDKAPARLTAQEFQKQVETQPGIIIDVRTQEEYNAGHLAAANQHHNLLNGDFKAQLKSLDKDKTYYLYCRSGNRSGQAAQLMVQNGFNKVYNIGGYQDLVDAGFESEK